MIVRFSATLLILGTSLLVSANTSAAPVEATWLEKGVAPTTLRGTTTQLPLDGFSAIAIAFPAPVAGAVSASTSLDGEAVPVALRDVKGRSIVIVTRSRGRVVFKMADATERTFAYQVKATEPLLIVAPDCVPYKAEITFATPIRSAYPAMMSCKGSGAGTNPILKQVMFTTTEDATWYGSDVFEVSGKGERYKMFEGKDVTASSGWTLNWGRDNAKTSATVKFIGSGENKKDPEAPLLGWAGLAFVSGTVTNGTVSSPISGFQVPVGFRFAPVDWHWFGTARYDLYAYDLGDATKASSLSTLGLELGYARKFGSFRGSLSAGYRDNTINSKAIGVTASLAAPSFNAELRYDQDTYAIGTKFSMMMATTDVYNQTDIGVFYTQKNWLMRGVRFELDSSTITSSVGTVKFNSSFLRFSTLIQF